MQLFDCKLLYQEYIDLIKVLKKLETFIRVDIHVPEFEFQPQDKTLLNDLHSLYSPSEEHQKNCHGNCRESIVINILWEDFKTQNFNHNF